MKLFKNDKECNLSLLAYADDLVLVAEREFSLRMMIKCFDLMCRKKVLDVNAGKSKLIVFGGVETV